jgi:hypothetical protein
VLAYFKYNMPTSGFLEKLRAILDDGTNVLIGADVNGHSRLWHCPTSNSRGVLTENLIEDYDLYVTNTQNVLHTYSREAMGASNIEVTLVTPRLRNRIHDWTVSDNIDSDHNTITYRLTIGARPIPDPDIIKRYDVRRQTGTST